MNAFSRRLLGSVAAVAAAAVVMVPSAAFAKGGPPPGRGGGGTETANNLSVPTVFVGGVGFGLPEPAAPDTWTSLEVPTGEPSTGWPIDPAAYYYVQGTNFWRAQYEVTDAATAFGTWGANLMSAALKAGHPVRVEMTLTSLDTTAKDGYKVVKLEPAVADRNSSYGTLAQSATGPATPTPMTPWVWTTGAYLTIDNSTTPIPMPGEINATGVPVFGFNWRPAAAGTYTLTFHVPATSGVTISNSNTGSDTSYSIEVTVTGGGGGGKGGGGHRG